MGGPNHTYFTYDRAYWRLRLFIILRVLRMIMAFAALGAFSMVLRAFWASSFSSWEPSRHLWRLPRCSWGTPGSSPGALWRDFDLPTRHSELRRRLFTSPRGFFKCFGSSPGALRCDFDVQTGVSELQTNEKQILVISYSLSLVTRRSSF